MCEGIIRHSVLQLKQKLVSMVILYLFCLTLFSHQPISDKDLSNKKLSIEDALFFQLYFVGSCC